MHMHFPLGYPHFLDPLQFAHQHNIDARDNFLRPLALPENPSLDLQLPPMQHTRTNLHMVGAQAFAEKSAETFVPHQVAEFVVGFHGHCLLSEGYLEFGLEFGDFVFVLSRLAFKG